MKIGIDARFFGLKHAGLGRYTQNLVLELEKIDRVNQYWILFQKENLQQYSPVAPNFQKVALSGHPYSALSQFVDWKVIRDLKLDLIHFTHFSHPVFYRGRFVVTIHDLIKNQFYGKGASTRSFMGYRLKHVGYKFVMNQAIERSTKIITPTNFVKDQILENYPVDATKIVPIYEGADGRFKKAAYDSDERKKIWEKYEIAEPFLIYVGNVYPYKNVDKLLEAMKWIATNQLDPEIQKLMLYIACSRSVFYDRIEQKIKREGLVGKVRMLGFVPDEELPYLYSGALSYITASLSEGFGITGIEAMACGAPVLSSNRSCLPEVYGKAALYFDPENMSEISQRILEVVRSSGLRKELKAKGEKQIKKYSWEKMARETLQVYNSLS